MGVLLIAGVGAFGYHWAFGKPKPNYTPPPPSNAAM